MSWIIIALLVLVAAFGPILWFKPSARDKRLTALRARGRSHGLALDVKALPRLNPTPQERVSSAGVSRDASELLAVYARVLDKRLRRIDGYRLLRAPSADAAPVSRGAIVIGDGWYFDPAQNYPPGPSWPAAFECLEPLASRLPADVKGLFVEPRRVGVYWAEGPAGSVATVDALAALLEEMAVALQRLDDALAEPAADMDP